MTAAKESDAEGRTPTTTTGTPSSEREAATSEVSPVPIGSSLASPCEPDSKREGILKTVTADGMALGHLPETLRADKEIVLAAVKQNGDALTFAASSVAGDMEVVCAAVRSKWTCGETDRYREVVLKTVAASERALGRASEAMRADRDVVMRAVTAHGESLQYASDELKADREVVLAAIKQNTDALRHVPALKADKEIALEAVRVRGIALKRFAESIKSDREVVLAAMEAPEGGGMSALQYADKSVRDEVKASVRATGQTALEALRNLIDGKNTPEDGGLPAVCRNRTDREEVLLEVAKANGGSITHPLAHSTDSIRDDEEVVLAAVAKYGESLQHASDRLRAKRNVAIAACSHNGDALRYCSAELRQDRDLVLRACRTSGNALKHASDELRNDREVVLAAVRQNGDALAHASEARRNDREVVRAAVEKNRSSIKFAGAELQKDPELSGRKADDRRSKDASPSKDRGPRAPTLADFATFKPVNRSAERPLTSDAGENLVRMSRQTGPFFSFS
jgi:predicted RNA-binding protein (virulence factor B family)